MPLAAAGGGIKIYVYYLYTTIPLCHRFLMHPLNFSVVICSFLLLVEERPPSSSGVNTLSRKSSPCTSPSISQDVLSASEYVMLSFTFTFESVQWSITIRYVYKNISYYRCDETNVFVNGKTMML